jgi:hypothetical protein
MNTFTLRYGGAMSKRNVNTTSVETARELCGILEAAGFSVTIVTNGNIVDTNFFMQRGL